MSWLDNVKSLVQGKGWQFGGPQPGTLGMWGAALGFGTYANSKIDYTTETGDLRLSSAIMVCLNKIMTAFPEPPVHVVQPDGKPLATHPVTALWMHPNPAYDGGLLGAAVVADYRLDGNAYLIKRRNAARSRVLELWYEPSWSIRPTWPRDGSAFLGGYQVYRANQWQDLDHGLEDVIHFRYGLDPNNTRLGLSPLKSALREIFTDNEAGAYIAALLKNAAVPPILIHPKGDSTITDPQGFKDQYMARFQGDRRGEPMVLGADIAVETLAFPPSALNLRDARTTPEERVAGLMDVPAMYAGLGAGLMRSTYSNYNEARAAFYDGCMIPTWREFGNVLTQRLLPDFGTQPGLAAAYDLSKVRALQDDQDAKAARLDKAFMAGRITRGEARSWEGFAARPQDDVYLVPRGFTVVPSEEVWLTPDPVQPAGMPPAAPPAAAPKIRVMKQLPGADAKDAPTDVTSTDLTAALALWREFAADPTALDWAQEEAEEAEEIKHGDGV